ncbi:M20 family metallopeptidase [Clostridium sp. Marseille-QA1073]
MNKTNYINKESVISLLSKLVEIPSPYFHEKEIMNFTYEWLKHRNLNPKFHHYIENNVTKFQGVNIVGSLKGNSKGPCIYLNAHLDTVNLCNGWTYDGLKATIEDNKLYGLGTLDMKSGAVAIMLALEAFKNLVNDFKGEIIYSFVSDEEGPYGLGTNAVIEDGIAKNADVAIVTEPSSGFCSKPFPCLCLGARGGYNYTVNLHGKSAHAANPDKGINAAVEAAKVMLELEKSNLIEDDKLGKGSICVISTEGGGQACSVPDTSSFTVFRHIVRGENEETIKNELFEAVKKANINSKVEFNFREAPSEGTRGFMPYTVDENNIYVQNFIKSIESCCGKSPHIAYFSSIGDFNYIGSRLNIPTLIFGADGENYHTANEFVYINSVIDTALSIFDFLINSLSI